MCINTINGNVCNQMCNLFAITQASIIIYCFVWEISCGTLWEIGIYWSSFRKWKFLCFVVGVLFKCLDRFVKEKDMKHFKETLPS